MKKERESRTRPNVSAARTVLGAFMALKSALLDTDHPPRPVDVQTRFLRILAQGGRGPRRLTDGAGKPRTRTRQGEARRDGEDQGGDHLRHQELRHDEEGPRVARRSRRYLCVP